MSEPLNPPLDRMLDRLIATHVMREWNDVDFDSDGELRGWHIREGETEIDSHSDPATSYDLIPHYSTVDEDAGEVQRELESRGCVLEIMSEQNGRPPFSCLITCGEVVRPITSAPSRAYALCLAALAVENVNYGHIFDDQE